MGSHMKLTYFFVVLLSFSMWGCSSSDLEKLIESVDTPDRKPLTKSTIGVNNFFVNSEFGDIDAQYSDIKGTLGVNYVRVLFAWTNDVQPSPDEAAFVGFYDEIINNAPAGVDLLIVVAHTPSWMTDSANWVNGNPRKTFVERWLKPLVKRYAGNPRVIGWEIWNEPNLTVVDSDTALGLDQAENYYELLTLGASAVRANDPGKKVVMAATESINQKYPNNLTYNKKLSQLGAASVTDIWNIHYYSDNYENVTVSGGIGDFLNGVGIPVWVTESGKKQPIGQLEYTERTWPFLKEEVSSIERFYYYEYCSSAALTENYGLRTADSTNPISDLYAWLRDN